MNTEQLFQNTKFSLVQLQQIINKLFYTSVNLPFNMEQQLQSEWCWAATSDSVSHFYIPLSGWTQCKIASDELQIGNCCTSPLPNGCNVPWYLDKALTKTDNLVSETGVISFSQIMTEIQAGRVIGTRIGWHGGGGHFMAIYGYSEIGAVQYLYIDDPIYGKSIPSLDTFTNSYQGSGSWTNTYFTKKTLFVIQLPPLTQQIWEPITEFRPIMKFNQLPGLDLGADFNLASPHPVYNMGINTILQSGNFDTVQTGLRVLETTKGDNLPKVMYDLSEKDNVVKVKQAHAQKSFIELYAQALNTLLSEFNDDNKTEAELRVLSIPGLYCEALWAHFKDNTQDFFIPVRATKGMKLNMKYGASEFMSLIKAAAQDKNITDNKIGA